MDLRESVTSLKGVGPKKAEALKKLGISTMEDLVFFLPRSYEDRRNRVDISDAAEDQNSVVTGEVKLVVNDRYRGGRKQMLRLLVEDGTGSMEVVFFNAKYLQHSFRTGRKYTFFGKVTRNFGKMQMIHPEFSDADGMEDGILPVYPLTKGISQREMRTWQKSLKRAYSMAEDILSSEAVERNRLCSLSYALENVHFPQEKQKLLEAKYRLIFDELLILQTGLLMARQNVTDGRNGIAFSPEADTGRYIESLPYPLTGAQQRCVEEIERDLESNTAMNRLVQGDVGCGKTALAEIAMYKAVKSGYQAVLMAPTEILAAQHFDGISRAFEAHGIRTAFLTGSLKAAQKREVLEQIATGEAQVIIGTHAVIQPDVEFSRLGLVITDEQHRFGVRQRVKLREKGENPNVLVMTATPIPRTLSVILYGDLDVSIIDELPPGRQQTVTRCLKSEKRGECYDFVEQQLKQGRQAYVVTPLIEESETLDAKSAEQVAAELKKRFRGYSVELIHGAMSQDEKDRIMESFSRGETDVLVATVVIEVGINVPNATVIVIENSERFGLAQLHQLRGRVGRGSHRSYCFLILDGGSEIAEKRGQIMEASSDGFFIAEEDLKLRGPGEIFGTRQHGLPDLAITDLSKHMKILEQAKEEAKAMLADDPALDAPEHSALRRRITKLFGEDLTLDL
ncbi:ATP-dependent DNA helicase recG [uncultured Eubacterium sp.]|uniref:ATP-dependent DNA helicase RecG n=1 Tax=Brotomerdimonas butyrica TaxID=2981721 RepID=UPI00082163A9|nr:ATP-dependent DNA helicase RecG [Brotomerdimonas butyrica]MCU6755936.1 ATP-dependent DNA helicase RecG [Brotomerdimonas butyrica]SCH55974.1 ATP-dependent DNA helicase recG [uncultured Eubacterium sp.]